jgi:hypothetical protein
VLLRQDRARGGRDDAAWITGSAFTQKGTDGFSMAMGVLTAVALLCYMTLAKISGTAR